jgi:glycosyltransferase involved in cell wall biosynthesis
MMEKKMRILTLNGWLSKGEKWIWRHVINEPGVIFDYLGREMWGYSMTPLGRVFQYDRAMLLLGLRAFVKMNKYDAIVSSHLSFGAPLAFLRGVLGIKKPPQYIVSFIIHERMHKVLPLLRIAMSGVEMAICHSRYEVEYYPKLLGSDSKKFLFVPYGVDTDVLRSPPNYRDQGYICAIGQAGRDYHTFFDAVRNLNYPVIMVNSQAALQGLNIPSTVKVLPWLSVKDFIKTVMGARCVVVPLQNKSYSSGQVAFLAGMALGKAVIVTKTPGSVDYVDDGKTGVLVPPLDVQTLKENIRLLMNDPKGCLRIGELARQRVEEKFSERIYARRIYDIVCKNKDPMIER